MSGTIRRVALGGLLAAMAVVLNHAMAWVPNVELTSLTIFVGGWLLGPALGAAVGAAATVAFSLSNPMGPAGPALLGVQCLAYAGWGAFGGFLAGGWLSTGEGFLAYTGPATRAGAMGLAGLLGTLWFQAWMNGYFLALSGLPWKAVLVPALPFIGAHLLSNTLAFAVLLPALLPRLETFRRRLDEA